MSLEVAELSTSTAPVLSEPKFISPASYQEASQNSSEPIAAYIEALIRVRNSNAHEWRFFAGSHEAQTASDQDNFENISLFIASSDTVYSKPVIRRKGFIARLSSRNPYKVKVHHNFPSGLRETQQWLPFATSTSRITGFFNHKISSDIQKSYERTRQIKGLEVPFVKNLRRNISVMLGIAEEFIGLASVLLPEAQSLSGADSIQIKKYFKSISKYISPE